MNLANSTFSGHLGSINIKCLIMDHLSLWIVDDFTLMPVEVILPAHQISDFQASALQKQTFGSEAFKDNDLLPCYLKNPISIVNRAGILTDNLAFH